MGNGFYFNISLQINFYNKNALEKKYINKLNTEVC